MDFFCIPIICGCQTNIKPEGDSMPRLCPHCNNGAVISAKSTEWFEICFVPLLPFSSKHIWLCGICNWSTPVQQGWEPMPVPQPGYYPPRPPPNAYWSQNPGQGQK